ncbi:hypothetical protein ABRY23_05535 [Melioribacteraceae bacterium 4301-Me]|uniref:DUF6913 domain-containing protein n=1 Tax=Pyranulibacter aquaticus TaxID=3163344 RepID=UPI003599B875
MLNKIKTKLAYFLIKKKYLLKTGPIYFNNIVSTAKDIFIVLPKNDNDFYHSLFILRYYLLHKKRVTIFLAAHRYNLIPEKEKYKYISYLPVEMNKFYLPGKKLIERLKVDKYDVLIDLNRDEDVFLTAVSCIVAAKLKIGFMKKDADFYYNLILTNQELEAEVCYKKMLNSLQMF